jgi:DNA-binding LytR/AlgR family response regulator
MPRLPATGWHATVDVLLLDISMPGISGVELARSLRQLPLVPQLVFTTAHEQYAVDAFELDAADYLLKPVRLERLRQALEKAAARCGKRPVIEAHFTVRHRDRLLNIPFSAVRYLKAEQNTSAWSRRMANICWMIRWWRWSSVWAIACCAFTATA